MRKSIRTSFFATLTIAIHLRIIFEIFFVHNIIGSLIGLLLFFVLFHFFYLDIYPKDNKKILLILLGITLVETIILGFWGDESMIRWLIVMNSTIIYLWYILETSANESVSFKAIDYFINWGYIFTFGMAIAYSLFTMSLYSKFPFSCTDLSQTSSNLIENISKPFNISRLQNPDNAKILSETKVKDLLSVGKILNIESDVTLAPLEQFKTRKNDLITKTLNENKELNLGICEFSLKKLNQQFKNPGFQASVVVLMVAVIYPFLRITIYVMSIIWLLIFEILKKAKVYTIQKVTAEIEKIW